MTCRPSARVCSTVIGCWFLRVWCTQQDGRPLLPVCGLAARKARPLGHPAVQTGCLPGQQRVRRTLRSALHLLAWARTRAHHGEGTSIGRPPDAAVAGRRQSRCAVYGRRGDGQAAAIAAVQGGQLRRQPGSGRRWFKDWQACRTGVTSDRVIC